MPSYRFLALLEVYQAKNSWIALVLWVYEKYIMFVAEPFLRHLRIDHRSVVRHLLDRAFNKDSTDLYLVLWIMRNINFSFRNTGEIRESVSEELRRLKIRQKATKRLQKTSTSRADRTPSADVEKTTATGTERKEAGNYSQIFCNTEKNRKLKIT